MKVGMLVHGCNLGAMRWEDIVWGCLHEQKLGRLTRALLLFQQFQRGMNAEVFPVLLGTGVRFDGNGKYTDCVEAEATRELLFDSEICAQLPHFQALGGRFDNAVREAAVEELLADFKNAIRPITNCIDTRQEIREAAEEFVKEQVDLAVLISSPVHLPRCLRDACDLFSSEDRFRPLLDILVAAPSATCYEKTGPEDVVIFEPPHRSDRPKYALHAKVERMLPVMDDPNKERVDDFLRDLDQLIDRYFRKRSVDMAGGARHTS